jgi:hypothetical protein
VDPYTLPPDLSILSDAALAGRLDEIRTLAANTDIDAEGGVERLESLADARDALAAELQSRADLAAADAERRAAVAARFADADPEPEPTPEPEPEPVVELAADPEPEPTPEPAPEPEPAVAELAEQPTPAPVAAATVTAGLAQRRTPAEMPRPREGDGNGSMQALAELQGVGITPGSHLSIEQVAESFAEWSWRNRSWMGSPKTEALVRSTWNFGEAMLSQAPDENYGIFKKAQQQYKDDQQALVASGGPCAPLMPTYEFYHCWSPQRPVEAFLPTVGAPRGGIRYINPVPLNANSAGAITIKDAADSALAIGAPGYTAKNCSRVSCPSETSVTVAAVSWCVTFDNLNFRVFPEQIQDFLQRVQVEHAKAKEIYYLDRIDVLAGAAVDVNAAQATLYGARRSLFRDLITAGHNYRKRNNMDPGAVLDILLPDVVEESLAVDMTNDNESFEGTTVVGGPGGNLTQALARAARLNVGFYYYDSSRAGFPSSAHAGAAGAWRAMPTRFRSYMWAPGSIVRLDAGMLDLGVVRDSTLNSSNDMQMFAEQWVEIAKVGCEVVAFDHTACYSGAAPNFVAPSC